MLSTLNDRLLLRGYLLSFPTVLVTVALSRLLHHYAVASEGAYVHPYFSVFLIPIAVIAVIGGRGPGFVTLFLSFISCIYTLMSPAGHWETDHPADWIELFLLLLLGALQVFGMDAARERLQVLSRSQEAWAQLHAVMDTAPIGMLISDLDGKLRSANLEAERIWGRSFTPTGPDGWREYSILDHDGNPVASEDLGISRVLRHEAPIIAAQRIIERPDGIRVVVDTISVLVRDKSGKPLGALSVFSDITEHVRADQEVQRLFDEAQSRAQLESTLNEIGDTIRKYSDPEAIQEAALSCLGEALKADRCLFVLYQPLRDYARVDQDWHRPELFSLAGDYKISDFGVDFGELSTLGITHVVADVRDADLSSLAVSVFQQAGVQALIAVPMYQENQLFASLNVMMNVPRRWTLEEINLIERVASQVRSAFDAAVLQRREHNIATSLQEALVPPLPSEVPGLEVASHYRAALDEASVGGDFFDVFTLSPGVVVYSVGDMSGKGLDAAAQVATVRNMLRYALYRETSLMDALQYLNDILETRELLTGFATLFVGVYDVASRRLLYISCGQEPALLWRAQTGRVEELAANGPVLGAVAGWIFTATELILMPGDMIAIFSDGVTEAGRGNGEFLGADGAAEILKTHTADEPASEFIKRLVARVDEFSQDGFRDDVCILATVVQE